MIQITTFKWVPPFVQGYVKDLSVRWALEEIGLPYELKLITREDQSSSAYRQHQPFGQVPVYQEGELSLFESGGILLHIGEKSEVLLPTETKARSRARSWVIAALNSVEPFTQNYNQTAAASEKETWAQERRPTVESALKNRLGSLNTWLMGKEYLEGRFSIGDIMMVQILRNVADASFFSEFPNLVRYLTLCESRPAFQKALAAQMKTFADNAPAS